MLLAPWVPPSTQARAPLLPSLCQALAVGAAVCQSLCVRCDRPRALGSRRAETHQPSSQRAWTMALAGRRAGVDLGRVLCSGLATKAAQQSVVAVSQVSGGALQKQRDIPVTKFPGQAFVGDLRSTSALGVGDGLTTHTSKWLQARPRAAAPHARAPPHPPHPSHPTTPHHTHTWPPGGAATPTQLINPRRPFRPLLQPHRSPPPPSRPPTERHQVAYGLHPGDGADQGPRADGRLARR